MTKSTFEISTPNDREIHVSREFNAPVKAVYDGFTKPDLVRQWLLGPPGWSMPVCQIDLKVGGGYKYVWRDDKEGKEMTARARFTEIDANRRLVAIEKFDEPWYPGEVVITTTFDAKGDGTKVGITWYYESNDARNIAFRSGMDKGMEAALDRYANLFAPEAK